MHTNHNRLITAAWSHVIHTQLRQTPLHSSHTAGIFWYVRQPHHHLINLASQRLPMVTHVFQWLLVVPEGDTSQLQH